MSDQLLYFTGIDGDTGGYDLPPMSAEVRDSLTRQPARSNAYYQAIQRIYWPGVTASGEGRLL